MRRTVSWRFRRALIRSFRPAAASALHEFQTIAIVGLAVLVWMTWANLCYGEVRAFLITLPTSLPAILWMQRRRDWLNRKDERGLLDDGERRRTT